MQLWLISLLSNCIVEHSFLFPSVQKVYRYTEKYKSCSKKKQSGTFLWPAVYYLNFYSLRLINCN